MFVISVSHKNADTAFREKLSLPDERVEELLSSCREKGIEEAVWLCTCNRCEFYGSDKPETGMELVSSATGVDISTLRRHARIRTGDKALRHVFRVASGMDSMVLGEDEILGQLRRAYVFSDERGMALSTFHAVFQAALKAAKRAKTDTLISKSSVSIATLAAAEAHRFSEGEKNVLIMGAGGDTGGKVMKNLLSYGDCNITVTTRNSHNKFSGVRVKDFGRRYEYMDKADVVISATKSPHYTVTKVELMEQGISDKRRLFIDLAVPCDIDSCVRELPGASLITIDDFSALAARNNEIKERELFTVDEIITEELDELKKELLFHDFMPEFEKKKECFAPGFDRFVYRYRKEANAEELQSFIDVLCRMEV